MDYPVKVFELPRDAKPGDRPVERQGFAVSGDTVEDARRAAMSRLASEWHLVRSLSFTANGRLAAVVVTPAPQPAAPVLRRRGGR